MMSLSESRFCGQCGSPVKASDKFCIKCGSRVSDYEPLEQPVARAAWRRIALVLGTFLVVAAFFAAMVFAAQSGTFQSLRLSTGLSELANSLRTAIALFLQRGSRPSTEPIAPSPKPSPFVSTPLGRDTPTPALETITPSPLPTTTAIPTPLDTEAEARNAIHAVIEEFDEIKALALRYLDDSQLETVLAGEALDGQRSSLPWLRENNAYWDITLHDLVIDSVTFLDSSRARVLVTKVETGLLYIDGKLSERSSYTRDTYQVSYDLDLIEGRWYITRKEAHEPTATETPPSISTLTSTGTPIWRPPPPICFQPEFKGKVETDHPLMRIRGYVFNRQDGGIGGVLVRIQAYDWSTEMRTWANGYYYFDGLANAVQYTISLPEYPCSNSHKVDMGFGTEARVDFVQAE